MVALLTSFLAGVRVPQSIPPLQVLAFEMFHCKCFCSHQWSWGQKSQTDNEQLPVACQCEQSIREMQPPPECPCLVVVYVYIFPCGSLDWVCLLCVWLCLLTVAHAVRRFWGFIEVPWVKKDHRIGLLWPGAKAACISVLLLNHRHCKNIQ